MKRILICLCCLFISFNVYAAKDYESYKEFSYTVKIDGENYVALVKYYDENINPNERFVIDSIQLTDSNKKIYKGSQIYPVASGKFCLSEYSDSAFCEKKDGFSYEEINNSEYMKNHLPKFIKDNNKSYDNSFADFLWYSVNEENMSKEEKDELIEIIKNYSYGNEGFVIQDSTTINSSSDTNYNKEWFKENYGVNDWSGNIYIDNAIILKDLIEEIENNRVCNEDDFNKIRTLRNVNLLDLRNVDISLSSSCHNILFGDGLGQGSLYSNVLKGYTYMSEETNSNNKNNRLTMSYLFYNSEYLIAISILSGSEMKQEINQVARCTLLGEKTTEFMQYVFSAFKMIGVVIGCLLCVVDVFKIVVQKDDNGKKQLGIMAKRIIGIIALILTPILVEIIFEFVNTIGVSDPICGIR